MRKNIIFIKDKYNILVLILFFLILFSFYIFNFNNYDTVILYIINFCLCFILCIFFILRNKGRQEFSLKAIIFIALTLRIILLFIKPITSDDYNRYLWDGKVQAEGINPYQYSPLELSKLHDNIIYPNVSYPEIKTIYPPVSQIIFYLSYILTGSNIYGLKIFYILFEAGILYFLYLTLKYLKINVNYIFLYVLSPLIIFEFFINVHIDIVILFFISGFIYFAVSGNTGPALLFLSFSVLSKTYSLIFLPVYLYYLKRSGMSFKNIFAMMFYFVLPLLILSFYGSNIGNIYLTMENYMHNWYFNNLIYVLLNYLLSIFSIDNHQVARFILIILFLSSYFFILRSDFSLVQKLYMISFFYLFFSHTDHQWYLTLLVLFLPVCFSFSALYWSGIIGLTNITVYYYFKNKIWEDFMPVLVLEYVMLIILIIYDIKRFQIPVENLKINK